MRKQCIHNSEKTLKNAENAEKQADLIQLVKSKYMQKSPATFVEPPKDKKAGYEGVVGNKERGRAVYELSCQHCHRPNGESDVILDNVDVEARRQKS